MIKWLDLLKDQYERDDFQLKPTDNFILAGKAEKDCCSLEVYGECLYIYYDAEINCTLRVLSFIQYFCANLAIIV